MESAQEGESWLPQTSEQWHISFRREGVEISLSLLPAPFDRNVNWEALLKDSRAEEREGTLYHLDTRALAPDGSRIARIFWQCDAGYATLSARCPASEEYPEDALDFLHVELAQSISKNLS